MNSPYLYCDQVKRKGMSLSQIALLAFCDFNTGMPKPFYPERTGVLFVKKYRGQKFTSICVHLWSVFPIAVETAFWNCLAAHGWRMR